MSRHPQRMSRAQYLRRRITEQQLWIMGCQENGVSYADQTELYEGCPRGQAIQQADLNELSRLQTELSNLTQPKPRSRPL